MSTADQALSVHRRPTHSGMLARLFHHHGLSIVLMAVFFGTLVGQTWAGWLTYNDDQRSHGQSAVSLASYLFTGHYWEALSENWESEFLQMGMFVLLTCWLYQKGSTASKDPDSEEEVDEDPRRHRDDPNAPWPVRRGGWLLGLYANSLSIALLLLFVISFMIHAVAGHVEFNDERAAHHETPWPLMRFVLSSRFWFQSFQNWQSEFLSVAALAVLSIFLRQKGSAESKPVHTPHWETE